MPSSPAQSSGRSASPTRTVLKLSPKLDRAPRRAYQQVADPGNAANTHREHGYCYLQIDSLRRLEGNVVGIGFLYRSPNCTPS